MDSIKAVSSTSPYIAMEHLNIYVNGKRLDEIIAEHTDPSYIGLIPAWLDFYDEDFAPTQKEKQYVWEQTHLTEKAKILPILLCPDDFDFSCTVVVVEVFEEGDNVRWNRFGVDVTEFDPNEAVLPKYIGRKVEWFSSLSACTFLKSEYLECIHAFSSTSLRNIDNSLG